MSFWRGAFVLLFIFSVLIIFKGPGDPDFGWHYKYGEYMVEHRTLLRANTFSYTFTDYKWANSYWLSELLLYLSHRYMGSFLAGLLFTLAFMTVVFLFFLLVWRGLSIARASPDVFGRVLAAGFTCMIGLQAFVNMGAISGLIPLTGVPLPFISYGGTALAVFLTMSGIVANISRYRR